MQSRPNFQLRLLCYALLISLLLLIKFGFVDVIGNLYMPEKEKEKI